jgi:SAM-dependent methyltransferase
MKWWYKSKLLLFLVFVSGSEICVGMLATTVNTVSNYENRVHSYSDWAWGSESAEAKKVRNLFINQVLLSFPKQCQFYLFDVGCGPGRDIFEFASQGHHVTGIDPSPSFCKLAAKKLNENFSSSQFLVVEGDITDENILSLLIGDEINNNKFDGAFCLSSLFHIPTSKLPIALLNIKRVLKERGVLFTSFPLDNDSIGGEELGDGSVMEDGRWCTALSVEQHKRLLVANGFRPLSEFSMHIYNGHWTGVISERM